MRMERPLGTRHDPVIVEDAKGADALLLGIAVAVEAEVPPGIEPAALLVPDRVGFPDDHSPSVTAHLTLLRRVCRGPQSGGQSSLWTQIPCARKASRPWFAHVS